MQNKIETLKKERASIIDSYLTKLGDNTYLDEQASKFQDIQHVIIKDIVEETKDSKSFILIPDKELGTENLCPFKAGQYISIIINNASVYTTRAYSLSSSPGYVAKNLYRITIKKVEGGLVSNYMLNHVKVGDKLTISRPVGEFTYNRLRDEKNVIAIAGGSGITPFISLAGAILDNLEDCNLTVFYSVKTQDDIMFQKEISEINAKSKKVRFIITLTREQKEGYLHGHITKTMLEPYIKEFNTVFMCGPKALYKSMNAILSEFSIPKKSVHYENFFMEYTPPEIQTYELKVILKNDFVLTSCRSDETLLVAMERAHIKAPSLCRVGSCGFCRSILLDGKIKMIGASMKKSEVENDYIHPCVSYPESNIVLRIDI